MAEEVKQGFSIKYIILVIFIAVIGGYFQYAFPHFLDSKEMKISFSTKGGTNELNENKIDKDIITVKYSLKNDTSEVRGFYHKYLFIENTGNIGLDNIDCVVNSKDKNIILLKTFKIENENNTNKVNYKLEKVSANEQIIKIPILNPGESISFNYSGYSKKNISNLDLEVTIRKKDLIVEETQSLISPKDDNDEKQNRSMAISIMLWFLFIIIANSELAKILYNRLLNFARGPKN